MEIGAVVVTHQSASCLAWCLETATRYCHRVVVVDNASSDETVALARRFPVEVIENPTNRGFAAAANQGFRALATPVVLLLNPDVRLLGPVDPLTGACLQQGAATGLLLDAITGQPQVGFSVRRFPDAASLAFEILGLNRLWPANPINVRYRCLDLELHSPADVEQPAGAFVMIRHDVWDSLGGFDERFHPLWFEDVDFLRRLALAGYRVRLVPEVRALHLGAHSAGSLPPGDRERFWYASLLTYVWKHFRPASARVLSLALAAAAAARILVAVGDSAWQRRRAYVAVIRWAGRSFWDGRWRGVKSVPDNQPEFHSLGAQHNKERI